MEFVIIMIGICSLIFLLFFLFFNRQADAVDKAKLKVLRDAWYAAISDGLDILKDVDSQYEYYWLIKERGKLPTWN